MEYAYRRHRPEMDAGQLSDEIEEHLGYGTRIKINKDVQILFEFELTSSEEKSLDKIVKEHVARPAVEIYSRLERALMAKGIITEKEILGEELEEEPKGLMDKLRGWLR